MVAIATAKEAYTIQLCLLEFRGEFCAAEHSPRQGDVCQPDPDHLGLCLPAALHYDRHCQHGDEIATMATLELKQIRKTYDDTEVIDGVDLLIESGEFCVFVGPSGCGKSTLLAHDRWSRRHHRG